MTHTREAPLRQARNSAAFWTPWVWRAETRWYAVRASSPWPETREAGCGS
jgi:hypothetical protein